MSYTRYPLALSGVVSSAKKDLESEANAAYAKAILKLQSDVNAVASLSPVSQFMFDVGKQAAAPYMEQIKGQLKEEGQELLKKVSDFALSELKGLFPGIEETVNSVIGTISEAMPGINLIMMVVGVMKQELDAQEAEIKRRSQDKCKQSLNVNVTPSGPSGESGIGYKATDIFSPGGGPVLDVLDPEYDGDKEYNLYPMSAFGRAFVGIFETLPNPKLDPNTDITTPLGKAIQFDHPQYHNEASYKRLASWYKTQLDPNKLEQNVGVPAERRELMKSIRIAMSSRSPASDSLFPIYLDLVADCMKRGWVTGGFMDFILSHYVTFPYETSKIPPFKGCHNYVDWDKQSWTVYPDQEWACPASGQARGAHPGSYCGEGGWRKYVDSIIKLVNSRPAADSISSELKKAKMLLGMQSGAWAKNFARYKQQQKAAILKASSNIGLLAKVAPKSNRSLELTKSQTILLVGGLGAGAALLGYLYLRQKKKK